MKTGFALLVGSSAVLLAACAPTGLGVLSLDGHDLHESLTTVQFEHKPARHIPRAVLHSNPQHSTGPEFIRAVARSGSQGKLDEKGVRSALHALYKGEHDLGFYGMEATSLNDADRIESALREIWRHNASINRARVHREGLVLIVVWTDGVSPRIWETVNAVVARCLSGY